MILLRHCSHASTAACNVTLPSSSRQLSTPSIAHNLPDTSLASAQKGFRLSQLGCSTETVPGPTYVGVELTIVLRLEVLISTSEAAVHASSGSRYSKVPARQIYALFRQ